MIWLNEQIERGRRHPVLGPILVIALALLLAFVAVHGVADQSSHDGYVCVGLILMLVVVLLIPRPRETVLRRRAVNRGPPRQARRQPRPRPVSFISPTPLRL